MVKLGDLKDFDVDKWNGEKIILYGGGVDCKYVIRGLVKFGILDWLICDKNGYKCKMGAHNNGVILPEELVNYPNANIVITSSGFAHEILDSLVGRGIIEEHIFLARDLTRIGVCDLPAVLTGEHRIKNRYIYSINAMIAKDNGFWEVSNIELILTSKCTLKCRDCGNMIPYCHRHEHVDNVKVLQSLDNLFAAGCYINKLEFFGGEPLLNQSLMVKVLRRYCGSPHIGKFTVVTNGTLLLELETVEAMRECGNVTVIISDYGELSHNIDKLISMLLTSGIDFAILDKYSLWDDIGRELMWLHPDGLYLNHMEVQTRFDSCWEKYSCSTIYQGKLYICSRIPYFTEAGMVPFYEEDFVDVMQTDNLKERCLAYINRKNSLETCRYCLDLHRLVERAVQLN